MLESEDIKNYAKTALYGVLILCVLIFTITYAFVDWEQVSEDSVETMKEISEMINCEIEYEQFYYKGLCNNDLEIFDLIRDLYQVNGTSAYQ